MLHSWRAHARLHVHGDPAQSRSSRGAWDRPSQVVEGLLGRCGLAAAHGRTGHWWQRPQEILISRCAPGSHCFGIKTWPYPPACRRRCWKASGQTTSRRGTQPSSDRPPKAILGSKPPLNTPLHTALFTEGQGPAPPTSGQAPVTPDRKPAQDLGPASPSRGQTPKAGGAVILQPGESGP